MLWSSARATPVLADHDQRGACGAINHPFGTCLGELIAQGLTLTNYCGCIDSFVTANPAYARVVDLRQPGRVAPFEARHETERLGQQRG